MIASYNMKLDITVKHEVEELPFADMKTDRELAEDICQMIADEASRCGAVVSYDIEKSSLTVK